GCFCFSPCRPTTPARCVQRNLPLETFVDFFSDLKRCFGDAVADPYCCSRRAIRAISGTRCFVPCLGAHPGDTPEAFADGNLPAIAPVILAVRRITAAVLIVATVTHCLLTPSLSRVVSTTCSLSDLQERARPCLPNASQQFCLQ